MRRADRESPLRGHRAPSSTPIDPDEAEQLTPHRGHDLLLVLAPSPSSTPVATVQPVLRLPGDRLHLLAQPFLALAQRGTLAGPMAVGPGRLDHDAPQVRVARLGDRPAPHLVPARVLARHHAAVAHQLSRMREARELSELATIVTADTFAIPRSACRAAITSRIASGAVRHRVVDRPLQPLDPLPRAIHLVQVVEQDGLVSADARSAPPCESTPDASRVHAFILVRTTPALAQQKLPQPMPMAQLIPLGGQPCPHQIAQRLVRRVGHPHRRQISGAQSRAPASRASRRSVFTRSPAFDRHQRRRHHVALRTELRQLPVVAVVVRLVRSLDRDADVLAPASSVSVGQLDAELLEVQPRDLFVELLRQHVRPSS